MEIDSGFFTAGLGFILTLLFGFWLSRKGKPYSGLIFNIHKLIALGTVILVFVDVNRFRKAINFEWLVILTLVIAALSVIALFASGAFMSAGKGEYRLMKRIHNIAPVFVAAALGLSAYLIDGMI